MSHSRARSPEIRAKTNAVTMKDQGRRPLAGAVLGAMRPLFAPAAFLSNAMFSH